MPPAPKVWSTADSFLAGFLRSRMELMESCPCRREKSAYCGVGVRWLGRGLGSHVGGRQMEKIDVWAGRW